MKAGIGSSRRAAVLALPNLVLKRAFSEKLFVWLRLIGLTIAVAVAAGVFIYLDALGQSALSQSLAGHRSEDLNIAVRARLDSISNASHTELLRLVDTTRTRDLSQSISRPIWAAKSTTLVFDQDIVPWKTARTFLAHVDGIEGVANTIAGRWPSAARGGCLIRSRNFECGRGVHGSIGG